MAYGDEKETVLETGYFNDFSGGVIEDSKDRLELPFWKRLDNLWIRDETEAHGRPHLHTYLGLTNPAGIAISHESTPIVLADGGVYINGALKGSYSGSGPVSYDYSREKSVFTAGGRPIVYDGSNCSLLVHENVKSLALAFGPSKSRLFFVKNTDPRTIWYTTRNWNDIGTTETDEGGLEYITEGGRIRGWDSDIIDIMEFVGDLVVICRRGVYRLDFTTKEGLMYPVKRKVGDIEAWDVKPIRAPAAIYFLNHKGPAVYSIGETGPFVSQVSSRGHAELGRNGRTIQRELVEGEAALGYDELRSLLFLKTKSDNRIWVLHLEEKSIFTRWDIDFKTILTIDGRVYLTNSAGVFEMKDEGDGQNGYTIILASGLLGFNSTITRKRMEGVGVLAYFSEKGQYHIGFLPDFLRDVNWIPTKFPRNYRGPYNLGGLCRIDEKIKYAFEIGAFRLSFKNYDTFILHDLFALWYDKDKKREAST